MNSRAWTVSQPRCLGLGAVATATAMAAQWLLLAELSPAATVEAAVVDGSVLALAGCVGWAWLGVLAAVLEAWRGHAARSPVDLPDRLRRLCLAACGVAVAGALAQPASAVPGTEHDPLDGLPLPERAVGAAHRPTGAGPAPGPTVTVRPGDCLWSLATDDLGPGAGPSAVEARWRWIYRLNKAVIGPDPQLIRPGQVLQLPPNR